MKRAAVIHTTPVTIPVLKKKIEDRAKENNIQTEIVNLLDDSILPEINSTGRITDGVRYRLNSLLVLAQTTKADAVLCACSSIGGVIENGRSLIKVPVLRIDEPMAEKASEYSRIAIAATLESTLIPTQELIERKAKEKNSTPLIQCRVIEGAGALLAQGKGAEYDSLVGEALKELLKENDIVVLAQASMARAVENWTEEEKSHCLTSVESGVAALIDFLGQQ